MRLSTFYFVSLVLIAPTCLWPQVAAETGLAMRSDGLYPVEWPQGPRPDSVPTWAKPGKIHFARWDGGRIETAKAILSGWPGFNPPIPDYLPTMINWYEPQTVRFLRDAGINMVWVTFSNGFSLESERSHQEQVRRYIAECHRQGIHVMAYESIANMFWEDMFQHVPESRNWVQIGEDGKPVPYGAGDYTKMGRVTRYMANLANPQWREYLKRRVDLAIDAGADGIAYDNNFGSRLVEVYRDIYQYASTRKKDFLLMGNFHQNTYALNRLVNCMTTEDGVEPGVYAEAHLEGGRMMRQRSSLLPVPPGLLVNNMGLFAIHDALSDGWKPLLIEDGAREVGVRETTPMTGARHQLALAEAMSFGISMELFVEGAFAQGLIESDPKTMAIWQAIGKYNRFFTDHEQYYVGARSVAPVAIILDDRSEGAVLLNGLAARGVLFDVIYEHDLATKNLSSYAVVVLLTAQSVRERALSALVSYVAAGGKVIAVGDAAALDETGRRRLRPTWFGRKTGKGECTYYERAPSVDELAKALKDAGGKGSLRVEAPLGVLYHVTQDPKTGRTMVHLLNYTLQPSAEIKVVPQKIYVRIKLFSPDVPQELQLAPSSARPTELQLPSVRIYSLLVLESPNP